MASANPHGNRIRVRIKVNGKPYSAIIDRRPTKANCKAAEKQLDGWRDYLRRTGDWPTVRAELRGEEHIIADSLHAYAERWVNTVPVDETTLGDYLRSYNRVWREPLGNRPITAIKKSEIREVLANLNVTPKTQRNYISVLSGIFGVAKDDEVIVAAPTDRWKFPKAMKKAPEVYTPEQRDALLDAITDPTARRLYLTGFYTGMRLSELLALQPRHLQRPVIRVEAVRSKYRLKERTKNYRGRESFAPDIVWDALEPCRFQAWLFQRPKGTPYTDGKDLQVFLDAAHEATGIPKVKTRNPWRHTYISIALMEGMRPTLVAQQTGHDLKTLYENYAAFIPKNTDHDEFNRVFGAQKGRNTPEEEGNNG